MYSAQPIKILNVNDDEAGRYLVTRLLKQQGFVVLEAKTGKEGIHLAQREMPHLVILDIKLPDISGFECCRVLKTDEATHLIPVLHLTAHALTTENKVQSIREGADAYLTFPLEPSYLIATIQSLLRLRRAEAEREELFAKEKAERHKLSEALKALENERALKEQFIATLTHDLRSPLAAIRLGAQMLMRKNAAPDLLLAKLGKIVSNADRADKMIQDLLDASLLRTGQKLPIRPNAFDLAVFSEDVVADFIASYGDRFRFAAESASLEVVLDASSIRRAIENLMNNALKYGRPDSVITLTLTEHKGQEVELSVHNFGNPIPEQELQTLFVPYRRALHADTHGKRGWGLGLALVQGVAEAHQGQILVRSSEGEGTTFTLRLPRKVAENRDAESATAS